MTKLRRVLAPAARSAVLLLFSLPQACSEVLIVPDGQGGAGTSFGDDAGPDAGSTHSSGAQADACRTLCEVSGPCLANCAGTCQKLQIAPCEEAGAELVGCLGRNYDAATCTATACQAEADALVSCRAATSPQCGQSGGGWSDQFCSVSRSCVDGEEKAACHPEDGVAVCVCSFNSIPVATCSAPWSPESCDLEGGCCASMF